MKKIFFAMMMFVSFQIFAERILADCAYLRSAEASSTLSEWLSGKEVVYDALNAFDNDTETVWVENADDSGIDERLTVVFYEPIKIDEIQIINGFAHKDYYKKNNRVKTLNIGFLYTDAGYVREYTLKDNCEDFQSIYLDETFTVDALVFTIQDVYRGTKYNDTCIDEIRFSYSGRNIDIKNVKTLKQAKKDAKAKASKNLDEDSALYKKLYKRAERYYQTKDGKYNGKAFLVPLNSGDEKGYAVIFDGRKVGFYDCWFRGVDDYKKLTADYEHLWQWKENPNINIYDYSFIVDIGYRYMDHREFSFDSSTNSVITEQGTVHNGPDGFGGGYEYRDYLVDVDPNSTYEPFSSVSEPNYRIDVNGNQYLLVDPECLFVDFWEP